MREVVNHESNGMLVSPFDSNALIARSVDALSASGMARAMDMRADALRSVRSGHGTVTGMNEFECICFGNAKAKEIRRVA